MILCFTSLSFTMHHLAFVNQNVTKLIQRPPGLGSGVRTTPHCECCLLRKAVQKQRRRDRRQFFDIFSSNLRTSGLNLTFLLLEHLDNYFLYLGLQFCKAHLMMNSTYTFIECLYCPPQGLGIDLCIKQVCPPGLRELTVQWRNETDQKPVNKHLITSWGKCCEGNTQKQ